MDANDTAVLKVETEYLRLRCGILEQVDRDMFGRGMAAGAACARADEAFSGAGRRGWALSVLTGILARRDAGALAKWRSESDEVRRWMAGEEFKALPLRVREWISRDERRVESILGAAGGGEGESKRG